MKALQARVYIDGKLTDYVATMQASSPVGHFSVHIDVVLNINVHIVFREYIFELRSIASANTPDRVIAICKTAPDSPIKALVQLSETILN